MSPNIILWDRRRCTRVNEACKDSCWTDWYVQVWGYTAWREPKKPCIRLGTYGRHLVNIIAEPVLGGDATCCCHYSINLLLLVLSMRCRCGGRASQSDLRSSPTWLKIEKFIILARDVIYTSRAYATMSVRLSVTEVHWRIIANLGFKFRSKFTAHCGRGEG